MSIPVSVNVPETPLQTPLFENRGISSKWNKWFASLGTWVSNASSIKEFSLSSGGTQIGTAFGSRIGRTITITGNLSPGTYSSTLATGMDVVPVVDTILHLQGENPGIGKVLTNGNFEITINSSTEILFTATFLAGRERT